MKCVRCEGKGRIVEFTGKVSEGDVTQEEMQCYECLGTGIEPADPPSEPWEPPNDK